MKAFQEYYPENVAHCYGCGRLNHAGHQIKTYWDGDETLTRFQPEPECRFFLFHIFSFLWFPASPV